MAISFKCYCGKILRAKDAYAGKSAKCPGCGQSVTIPPQSSDVPDRQTDSEQRPLVSNGELDTSKTDRRPNRVIQTACGVAIICCLGAVVVSRISSFNKQQIQKAKTKAKQSIKMADPASDLTITPAEDSPTDKKAERTNTSIPSLYEIALEEIEAGKFSEARQHIKDYRWSIISDENPITKRLYTDASRLETELDFVCVKEYTDNVMLTLSDENLKRLVENKEIDGPVVFTNKKIKEKFHAELRGRMTAELLKRAIGQKNETIIVMQGNLPKPSPAPPQITSNSGSIQIQKPSTTNSPDQQPIYRDISGAELAVQNVAFNAAAGLMEVSGQVRNLTQRELRLDVKAEFVAAKVAGNLPREVLANGLIRATGSDLIKPLPLAPGQVGDFVVRAKHDHLVKDFLLTFKDNDTPLLWRSEIDRDSVSRRSRGPSVEVAVSEVTSSTAGNFMQISGKLKNLTNRNIGDITTKVNWLSAPHTGAIMPALQGYQKTYATTTAALNPSELKPGEMGTFLVREPMDSRVADYSLVFVSGNNALFWQVLPSKNSNTSASQE